MLQISLKFQIRRIQVVRVTLLAKLKNSVFRKAVKSLPFCLSTYLLSEAFDAEGCYIKNKIFLGTKPLALYLCKLKLHFKQKKKILFNIQKRCYSLN